MGVINLTVVDNNGYYSIKEVVDYAITHGSEIEIKIITSRLPILFKIVVTSINGYINEYHLEKNMSNKEFFAFRNSLSEYINKQRRLYNINRLLGI